MILTLCEFNLGWLEYEEILQKLLPDTFAFTMRQALMLASNEEKV